MRPRKDSIMTHIIGNVGVAQVPWSGVMGIYLKLNYCNFLFSGLCDMKRKLEERPNGCFTKNGTLVVSINILTSFTDCVFLSPGTH